MLDWTAQPEQQRPRHSAELAVGKTTTEVEAVLLSQLVVPALILVRLDCPDLRSAQRSRVVLSHGALSHRQVQSSPLAYCLAC